MRTKLVILFIAVSLLASCKGGSYPSDGAAGFVLLLDGTYTCDGDNLTYATTNPATGQPMSIPMSRA